MKNRGHIGIFQEASVLESQKLVVNLPSCQDVNPTYPPTLCYATQYTSYYEYFLRIGRQFQNQRYLMKSILLAYQLAVERLMSGFVYVYLYLYFEYI